MTQYGRHGVLLILQAGCHGTAVDQFGGGTEKAPALSLVTHCQDLDAQGESQADEFVRQGFNLICTVFTFEQYMVKRYWLTAYTGCGHKHARCVGTPGKKIPSLQGEVRSAQSLASA